MTIRADRDIPTSVLQRFDQPLGQSASETPLLDPRLATVLTNTARIEQTAGALRLAVGPTSAGAYCNAQLDDYHQRRPRNYLWRPPTLLRVRMRASHPASPAHPPSDDARARASDYLRGTAGCGFWNASLSLAGGPPRPPEAIWFFAASPPSNMALTPGVPGFGWKAQVVHAHRLAALAAVPPLAATALWSRISGDERAAARWLNRLTGAHEALLDPVAGSLSEWHDYEIEWTPEQARFRVDGRDVLEATRPPSGPLGFVVWIDTQYAIVTPRGTLRFGSLATNEQWLELASLSIQPLSNPTG
ncbi:MAG TPA: family 16 glycosylhydrolase [Ktedonobacterales bacterium]